jgi:hypothetical protein
MQTAKREELRGARGTRRACIHAASITLSHSQAPPLAPVGDPPGVEVQQHRQQRVDDDLRGAAAHKFGAVG